MKSKDVNMLSGSVTKGLITLALPIMIMNVGQTLFNVIDMTVLKIFSDDSAVGAIGASGSLISLCTALLIGISVGANIVVAKRIGMKNNERVEKAIMTALSLAIAGGLLLMIIGVVFSMRFLKMTNCPDDLIREATIYFKLYFVGIPFLMLYNFCAAILRAAGDTKRPMYYLILGGIIKVIFTLLFAAVFNMRAKGVAASTIISNIVISMLALRTVSRIEIINFNLRKLRFYGSELKEMLFVGIPSGLQTAMYSFANVIIMTVVNGFGAYATTGISIANQFDGIMYQVIYAPSLAVVPYVAQNIGAGNIKRMKEAVLKAVFITTAIGAFMGAFFAIFSGRLSSIMSDTPEVIRFSQQKMIIISSTYFLHGINEILGGTLKGMGRPIIPAVATLLYMCLFRFVWVYVIYPSCPQNLTFLYLVWPVGWILCIVTLLAFYILSVKKVQSELS